MSQQDLSANDVPQDKPITKSAKAPSFLIPIFRLPLFLYQLHLGWLLGTRFMQITHVGRRSGRVHRTGLAVLRFDDKTQTIYAVSAWEGSDWYHNIQSSPALTIETGFVNYVTQQRTLSPQEITAAFMEY